MKQDEKQSRDLLQSLSSQTDFDMFQKQKTISSSLLPIRFSKLNCENRRRFQVLFCKFASQKQTQKVEQDFKFSFDDSQFQNESFILSSVFTVRFWKQKFKTRTRFQVLFSQFVFQNQTPKRESVFEFCFASLQKQEQSCR